MASTHKGASRRGEGRLPAVIAVLSAVALYAALPNRLVFENRYAVPSLELALLIPLIAVNPTRFTRENGFSRAASLLLVVVIAVANLASLGSLVGALLGGRVHDGKELLVGALQVWLTNVIVFGLGYWELDRGGPVKRTQLPRDQLPAADFRFSQDENQSAIGEVAATSSHASGWIPSLIDYLYLSMTNSTAFSPTDTMPLSARAKVLMSVQGMGALIVTVLVIARSVNVLQPHP